jgi:hypothetical protein
VVVVIHDDIGADINAKHGAELFEFIFNPTATMLKALLGNTIYTTQITASHTPGDNVIIGGGFRAYKLTSWYGHWKTLTTN